jgi:uncharacterized delta-60 repeat protein
MKKLVTFILLAATTIINSQTIQLDPNFGTNGFVTLPGDSNGDSSIQNKIQSDGKILVSGQRLNGSTEEDFIARYNQNGTLDTTFGVNGFYIFVDSINDINGPDFYVLKDNSVVCLIDDIKAEISKLDANGMIDTSFGSNGKMNFDRLNNQYLDDNDNLFIGTGIPFQLIKINTINGIIDTSFGSNGIINLDNSFNDIYSFHNNKFLVQSTVTDYSATPPTYTYTINRFLIDGSKDNTFGTNGAITLYTTTNLYDYDHLGFIVNVDANNNDIYVTESNSSTFSSITKKYDINGNQLLSFGSSGISTISANNLIFNAKLYNNKLYFSGANNSNTTYNTSLLRYNTNGVIDNAFNTSGLYIENTNSLQEWADSMSINTDGSFIVSGEYTNGTYNKMYLAKYIDSKPLATNTFNKEFDLKYQNPIKNKLELISTKTISSITLYGLDGKQIGSSNTNCMDVSQLETGIYLAKITSSENEIKIIKLIKK